MGVVSMDASFIMHPGVKDPGWFELGDVGRVDLVDILVTHVARIVAIIGPIQVFVLLRYYAPGYGSAYGNQ